MNVFKRLLSFLQTGWTVLWERFSRLSAREKKIAVAAMGALLAAFVNFGVLEPIQKGVQGMQKEITEGEREALRNMRDLAQKPALDTAYLKLLGLLGPQASSNLDEIRSSVLHDIESQGRQCGVSLTEIKPQPPVETAVFRQFLVRTQVEGTMEQVLNFLAGLIKTRKLYYVESLRLTPHSEDVNKVKANISIGRAIVLEQKK